jgi:hypothetical protein
MKEKIVSILFTVLSFLGFAQTQPGQPATGYGGQAAPYSSITTFSCDDGATGFMLYMPVSSPHADTLPLIVFMHGFGEWNPLRYGHWIEHLVKRGNIVVFPRYQQNEYLTPSTSFTSNSVTGLKRAIDTIQHHPAWTQPEMDKVFYMGHSYGGLITANFATNYVSYGIPKPKGILMACPGYGQYPGGQLSSYSAMDSSIKVIDIFEKQDNVVDSTFALQVFNQTTLVPYSHKNLVIHFADSTGTPHVVSSHGQAPCIDSALTNGDNGAVMLQAAYAFTDATDFYCYWKLFDALEDCALTGNGCTTAFGDTHAQEFMGLWSNGAPIRPLEVRPVVLTTGINSSVRDLELKVYPNPGSGQFTFELKGGIYLLNGSMEVYNVLGKKISVKSTSLDFTLSMDLSNQVEGIYYYRLIAENGSLLGGGKIIKR